VKNRALIELIALIVFCVLAAFTQSQPSTPNSPSTAAPLRVKVAADEASSLVVQKAPLTYPDAARNAGIQGTVVLRVVTDYSGDVKEVTIVSGYPALAQAAADAVKQWKYKPYLVDGSPAEMETQVTTDFHLKSAPPPSAPPLGIFRNDTYVNDYFGISYPLSRDWVRETDLLRARRASSGNGNTQGIYILLAVVHIPQDTEPLRADSEFTVLAVNRSGTPSPNECKQYLESVASDLHSRKEGQQKGDVSQLTFAGHDFYRGDFEFRHGIDHRTFLCTSTKDYRLQWNIAGWSKQAIETAVATLQSMTPPPMATPQQPKPPPTADPEVSKQVRVPQGMSTGLLVKKVTPVYPQEAKQAHIQGTVRLRAVINKTGDIADLEVMDGPIELVVSAVNAVRKWKYRPYLLNGEPVAVQTEIVVNYALSL
jgi:TonB family protein